MADALKTIITPEMRALYEAQAAQWPAMKRALSQNPSWYVGQVLSGSERVVAEKLTKHGFGLYYPKFVTMTAKPFRRMSKRQREAAIGGFVPMQPKIRALLPGYMFLHFDIDRDPWRGTFEMIGVRGIWSNGNNLPKQVPDELISNFTSAEVDGLIPGKTPLKHLFKIGDQVRVGYGPFASFGAVVDELPPGYGGDTPIEELGESLVFKVLVDIFGRATPVEMLLGQFEHI